MSDKQRFSCLLRPEEREALRQMAQNAERSEGAMIRTLIREAARARGVMPKVDEAIAYHGLNRIFP